MKRTANQLASDHLPLLVDRFERFPLTELPLGLLEKIAAYFSRREATDILTVSKLFHSVFAHTVWKYLDFDPFELRAPLLESAWKRYRHLIRSVRSTSEVVPRFPPFPPPNLVRLTVEFDGSAGTKFFGRMMPSLRYLSLIVSSPGQVNKPRSITSVVAWINKFHQHNKVHQHKHKLAVRWWFFIDSYINKCLGILENILAKITMLDSHEFYVHFNEMKDESMTEMPKLAKALKHLSIINSGSGSSFAKTGKLFIDKTLVFPRLESLVFNFYEDEEETRDAGGGIGFNIIPGHFPMLTCLTLNFGHRPHSPDVQKAFTQKWPTVIELVISSSGYGEDEETDIWKCAVRACPALERLTFSRCTLTIYPNELAEIAPRLRKFSALNCSDFGLLRPQKHIDPCEKEQIKHLLFRQPHQFLEDLTHVCLFLGTLHAGMLQLIICLTPNLKSIVAGIRDKFEIDKWALDQFHGQRSTSVQRLLFDMDGANRFNADDAAAFIRMLPNLESLVAPKKCLAKLGNIRENYPDIVFREYTQPRVDQNLYDWFYPNVHMDHDGVLYT